MIPFFGTTGWQIGFLKIQSWGLLVTLGFVISFLISWQLTKKQKLNQEILLDLFVWLIMGSLVMSRLFYVLWENNFQFYFSHPVEIFKVWQGGFTSFGGFVGAGMALSWFWYKKKINWQYLDILVLAFPFGWAVGRIGCFLIHDHLGRISSSFLAVNFVEGARLDMALMEIVMLLPLLIIFAGKGLKMILRPALLSSVLFLWYGIGRFLLDFLRARDTAFPDAFYLGLTVAQWGSILLVILGIRLWQKRKQGRFA